MRQTHPRNPWISNGRVADLYLWSVRRGLAPLRQTLSLLLGSQISCPLPDRLFIPHPFGIIVGEGSYLGENVTLMQQVTLGGKDPWCAKADLAEEFPTLEEGVYVGAGAKILGAVTVGAWAIVGANAVITKDVPAGSTVVGCNKMIAQS